jgi:hypothetical protein
MLLEIHFMKEKNACHLSLIVYSNSIAYFTLVKN